MEQLETVGGPGTHPKAFDPSGVIQKEVQDRVDPSVALESLLLQKQLTDTENQQLKAEVEQMRQKVAEREAFAEKFEPYADIFNDTRAYLPVYIRRPILFQQLLAKLRDIYGPLADVNAPTKKGQKLAHRTVDHAMEVILERALVVWHEVKPLIEGTQYGTS